jgi:hypothetical protein
VVYGDKKYFEWDNTKIIDASELFQTTCTIPSECTIKPENPVTDKIIILSDGKITTAEYFKGNVPTKTSVAKKDPKDEVDFKIGAEYAFDRLFEKEPKKISTKFKVGDTIRVTDNGNVYSTYSRAKSMNKFQNNFVPENSTIAKITKIENHIYDNNTFVLYCETDTNLFVIGEKGVEKYEKPKFVPHLQCGGANYGNISDPTEYKDIIGQPLKIGDTVTLYNGIEKRGEYSVVSDEKYGVFIMGIQCLCSKGIIEVPWKIVKCRDCSEIKHGEKVDNITYLLHE